MLRRVESFRHGSNSLLIFIGSKGVFASLTLGGYDSSRYEPNDVVFGLSGDQSRDLEVGLQRITTISSDGTSIPLLPDPILTFIDSTQAMIYLPTASCKVFESTFGLLWNETAQRYWVDEELHNSLRATNPTITFTLSDSLSLGRTVDIVLPYASFDLLVQPPAAERTTRLFPLRRASKKSQYTLGRTFLQEAYVQQSHSPVLFH